MPQLSSARSDPRDDSPAATTSDADAESARLLGLGPLLKQFLQGIDLSAAAPDSQPLPDSEPVLLSRYRLLRVIGEGGMGSVYEAEQNHPRRRVAVKVIKPGMDSRQVIARFDAEREALGRMDHPNIARVFDAGATEAGRPFFAMELVDGDPITDYCAAKGLALRQRLELLAAVCRAVQHAHQKGIIHRDLKPSNILVATVDGGPVPKVIDFGIAKATQPRPADQTALTEAQQLIGTPEYMSPEQAGACTGGCPGPGGDDVDTRSDVYSLGVVLYELITGTTPFADRRLRDLGYDEARRIVREVEPARPSTRVRRPTRPDGAADSEAACVTSSREVRGDLDWIVMRCLEKDRSHRYDSPGELAADLERHLRDEPVLAGPPTTSYRMMKFARRHRAALAAAAAIAALLVAGVAGTTVGMVRARQALARAGREADKASATDKYLGSIFAYADAEQGGAGPEARVADLLQRAEADMAETLKGQPEVELRARHAMLDRFRSLGMMDELRRNIRRASDLVRGTHGEKTQIGIDVRRSLAEQFDDLPDREAVARAAAADADQFLGHHPTTAWTKCTLALVLVDAGRAREAEAVLRPVCDELRRRPLDDVNPFFHLGQAVAAQGRLDEAERLLREAETWARAHMPRACHLLRINYARAAVLARGGAQPQACDAVSSALAEFAPTLGYDHVGVAEVMRWYAGLLDGQGRAGELAPLKRAIEASLARRAERPATTAAALRRRAFGRAGLGQLPSAADDYGLCVDLDPSDHDAWCARAAVLALVPDPQRYEAHCRAMLDRFGGTTDRVIADRTAKACLVLPRPPDECRRLLRLADVAVDGGKPHEYLPWFHLAKAIAAYRAGEFEAAVESANRALDHGDLERDAGAGLIAAMAHHRLGHRDEAAARLARAKADANSPVLDPLFAPAGYGVRTTRAFEIEADALIGTAGQSSRR